MIFLAKIEYLQHFFKKILSNFTPRIFYVILKTKKSKDELRINEKIEK